MWRELDYLPFVTFPTQFPSILIQRAPVYLDLVYCRVTMSSTISIDSRYSLALAIQSKEHFSSTPVGIVQPITLKRHQRQSNHGSASMQEQIEQALGTMNFEISDEQTLILNVVDEACKKIRPIEDKCYLEHKFNDRVLSTFKDARLLGLPISRRYGEGQGADALTYALALERVGQEGTGVRTFFSGHTSLGQLTLQKWGNDEQRERYLPKTTRGEMIMAFGLTEPTAGSDPASLKTNFEERGDYFYLNGSKAWISNGSIAHLLVIFAYPKGKSEGMCTFLVEKKFEGFRAEAIKNKLGLPTSDTGLLYLTDCKVPKENILGPRGKGLSVAYSALMSGRLSVAAGCVGVTHDCLNEAVRYAKERVQHKKKIGKHQLVQREIAKIAVELETSRLLTYKAAVTKTKSDNDPRNTELRDEADWQIAEAKYYAANASFDAADRAVQVFGANGFSFENRPARHLVDTRVCRIYEGTDQILEQKIAVRLLGNEYEAYS
jgi:alkylation response protein AidB-like acyl-CoA dehydrogenase